MTAKECLSGLWRLQVVIDQDRLELKRLEDSIETLHSVDYSRDRVQTTHKPDAPYVPRVNRLVDMGQALRAEIARMMETRCQVVAMIQRLDDARYATVLYKHYAEGKGLKTIAAECGYSYGATRRIHGEALRRFAKSFLPECEAILKMLQNVTKSDKM
nr:MAG TPA: Protein of unknown function (DUF1492) [Caudoviricetes sp.]